MDVRTPTHQVETIGDDECRTLLEGCEIGRVAFIADDAPTILPVDFMLYENMIVFRSDPGSKVAHIPLAYVCFEADGAVGPDVVWSVVVHGPARDVTTALNDQFEQMRRVPMSSFAVMDDPHWLAIDIERISGRRLTR